MWFISIFLIDFRIRYLDMDVIALWFQKKLLQYLPKSIKFKFKFKQTCQKQSHTRKVPQIYVGAENLFFVNGQTAKQAQNTVHCYVCNHG